MSAFPGQAHLPSHHPADLPRTDGIEHAATALLHHGRPLASQILRRYYRVEVHGAAHVPATGAAIVAANHIGFVDGPMLSILCRRPVHSLTKIEMFDGPMGAFLRASGQIPVRRHETDLAAVRGALAVLRAGGVLGVFPEGTRGPGDLRNLKPGAAYFAMVTGAPVVPLIYLGTRLPGANLGSIPPRGSRVTMTYGEPVHIQAQGWPRRRSEVRAAGERVRAALSDTLRRAQALTGMTLPGPAPDGEVEE